eukprot:CAMPEP_0201518742 /NCGR_PEP_ID=MMETSP0161_2-20130828/9492_1 /ASSEMBLY_ACC=CAM_ASM_000251 /TAXON_ID=180227 /ORGANISM="Neoparamoeba aestuarina, Strain SoJaBio B1-5/56/2" /LENGTH=248 /DNA_ID=CAMNT_0047916595 /DNA_START=116 /DNA_END=862 /DNA_ORIENTATION=+
MTVENLAQLQYLLQKYAKYKHHAREDEEERIIESRLSEEKPKRRQKKSKKQRVHRLVEEAPQEIPAENVAASCCGSCDSGESTYSSWMNSLYSWYYGDSPAEDTANVKEEDVDLTPAEEKKMKQIAQYVRTHGHHFDNNVEQLREKDLKKLMTLLNGEKVSKKKVSRNNVDDIDDKGGFSSAQKGIMAGVLTVAILLLLSGIAFFFIKKYGLPKRFVKNTREYVSRGRERSQPLRAQGPNVSHIYPPP